MTWGVGGRRPTCLPEMQTGLLSIPRTSLSASVYTRFAKVRASEEVVRSDDQFVTPTPARGGQLSATWSGLSCSLCLCRPDIHRDPSGGPRGDQGDHGHAALRSHARPTHFSPVSSVSYGINIP